MRTIRHRFFNEESVAFAMMKSGTINYRNFSEFIIIKDEKIVVDLSTLMQGIGGDAAFIHARVMEFLKTA